MQKKKPAPVRQRKIWVHDPLWEPAVKRAEKEGCTTSDLVRRALAVYLGLKQA